MNKIKVVVLKEWAEVFRNKLVLFSVAFLPLVLLALPFIMVIIMNNVPLEEATVDDIPEALLGTMCGGMSEADCALVYMLNLFTIMLMILPVMIPVTIAAYSIVGEKTSRTLEPLLATPITTSELLTAKAVAAVLPAVVATFLSFVIYSIGLRFMVNETIYNAALGPIWWFAIIVVAPLLSLFSVCLAIIVSSRVTDPRVAEQMSGIVILPIILIIVGQSLGIILIEARFLFLVAVITAVADAILLYFAVQLFQRERILTQWK
ncbi:MAG: ABC transporter permease subunit [Anaerolineae bacterium]|nr:ABC transporter permease subunit [Anaerolineae bacterium]MCO5189877.1 ABC transporter permease subunit [Anaerolineae bacterium]MCO5192335.1 ABC transporter permease subunit [Anaerolineae bacterium]